MHLYRLFYSRTLSSLLILWTLGDTIPQVLIPPIQYYFKIVSILHTKKVDFDTDRSHVTRDWHMIFRHFMLDLGCFVLVWTWNFLYFSVMLVYNTWIFSYFSRFWNTLVLYQYFSEYCIETKFQVSPTIL